MLATLNDNVPIRKIIAEHGRLAIDANDLEFDTNLYNAGLTSLATVGVMLALEEHFNIEFPDSMLTRRTFESLDTIAEAIAQLAT